MACRLLSASVSRRRNSSMSRSSTFTSTLRRQSQSGTQAFGVTHVADDAAQGFRLVFHQRRRRENLLVLDQVWLLVDIHDLELEPVLEAPLAQLSHRADRARGPRCHAGDEQPQYVTRIVECIGGRTETLEAHALARRGRRSRPTSTRSVFDRSPMIFLMGVGSRRTNVGNARIWSPRPSAGLSIRSITSML